MKPDWQPDTRERQLIDVIAEARKAQGLSYDKLAQKTGLHRTSISLIERGHTHPTLLVYLKLCKALEIEP